MATKRPAWDHLAPSRSSPRLITQQPAGLGRHAAAQALVRLSGLAGQAGATRRSARATKAGHRAVVLPAALAVGARLPIAAALVAPAAVVVVIFEVEALLFAVFAALAEAALAFAALIFAAHIVAATIAVVLALLVAVDIDAGRGVVREAGDGRPANERGAQAAHDLPAGGLPGQQPGQLIEFRSVHDASISSTCQ